MRLSILLSAAVLVAVGQYTVQVVAVLVGIHYLELLVLPLEQLRLLLLVLVVQAERQAGVTEVVG
jgi:hypothetical protein